MKNLKFRVSVREGTDAFGMNMALHVGDSRQQVLANREKMLAEMGCAAGDLVCCRQVHGTKIMDVTAAEKGMGAFSHEDALPDCDGMITDVPDIVLGLFFADCVPVLLYDGRKKVLGIFHAGWKGTLHRIAGRGLAKMSEEYGCAAGDIHAFIGPAIRKCHYEVEEALFGIFCRDFPEVSSGLCVRRDEGFFLDLPGLNREILLAGGMKAENIEDCGICTFCSSDRYFSHRHENGNAGRHGLFAVIQGLDND